MHASRQLRDIGQADGRRVKRGVGLSFRSRVLYPCDVQDRSGRPGAVRTPGIEAIGALRRSFLFFVLLFTFYGARLRGEASLKNERCLLAFTAPALVAINARV